MLYWLVMKRIGWVSEYGHRLNFDEEGIALCKESNQEIQSTMIKSKE